MELSRRQTRACEVNRRLTVCGRCRFRADFVRPVDVMTLSREAHLRNRNNGLSIFEETSTFISRESAIRPEHDIACQAGQGSGMITAGWADGIGTGKLAQVR